MSLKDQDPELYQAIENEKKRAKQGLELIASENYTSQAVLEAMGSILTNKYAEGYPHRRYYGGNEFIDQVEDLAIERAKKLFGAEHVNVQPYSGTPANIAVYVALVPLGEKIMAMKLAHGGHLSHGHKVSFTGQGWKFVHYGVNKEGWLDYDEIERLAKKEKPKLIVSGFTAYPRVVDFKKFHEIAKEVGAYSMADIAHIAGIIATGQHPSPLPFTDVVTTTTHKTLRGPRSAMIMCKKELAEKIDRAVFPGLQGGPHEHIIAAKAVCFKEAMQPEFKDYIKQVLKNAKTLALRLQNYGFELVSGGTDNHLMLVDLTNKKVTGKEAETALDKAGITVNKNMIPYDPRSPFDPSGIRIGTPAVTSRGMKEKEMEKITFWINKAIENYKDKKVLAEIKKEVIEVCQAFPVPGT